MRKILALMLLSFLMFTSFITAYNSISASGSVENSWNTKASMSQARSSLGVVAVGGKIYAIGGFSENGLTGVNECYDPVFDTWVTLEPMLTPRAGFAIAAYEGKIYCMGGKPANSVAPRCNITEVYDTATNTWSTKASMPFYGSGLKGLVVDGKIFVMDVNMLFMYDPATDTWTRKPDAPYYLFQSAAAVVDNKIIFTGNFITSPLTGPQRTPITYAIIATIYDIETDTWSEGKTDDTFTSQFAVAEATRGLYAPTKMYVFLGTTDSTGSTLVYAPTTDTWSAAKSMPSARISFSVAVLDDVLYVIGGLDYQLDKVVSTNEQYIPIGYNDQGYPDASSPVTSPPIIDGPFASSNSRFICIIVATLVVLTVSIVVALLLSKKEKEIQMRT
jgi:N-acetylneuraminic acid mutarotase